MSNQKKYQVINLEGNKMKKVLFIMAIVMLFADVSYAQYLTSKTRNVIQSVNEGGDLFDATAPDTILYVADFSTFGGSYRVWSRIESLSTNSLGIKPGYTLELRVRNTRNENMVDIDSSDAGGTDEWMFVGDSTTIFRDCDTTFTEILTLPFLNKAELRLIKVRGTISSRVSWGIDGQ